MPQQPVTIVGGCNVDIAASAATPLIYGDSNPGRVRTELGGVGRNIAENIARLRGGASLLTAFGDDDFSFIARNHAQRVGINIADSLSVLGAASSTYVYVNDSQGDLAVAVNDMAICDQITPEFLYSKLELLDASAAVVFDANLSEAAVDFLSKRCSAPLYADAVSIKKAPRLRCALPYLAGLKGNRIEIEALAEHPIACEDDVKQAARKLHQAGVQYVVITLGKDGAFISDGKSTIFERSLVERLENANGCGDALFAAAICALLDGKDAREALRYGLASAALCAASERSVSEQLTPDALLPYLSKF